MFSKPKDVSIEIMKQNKQLEFAVLALVLGK